MRRAFTLVELIFVIVVIATLVGVGVYSFKPKHLRNDTDFVVMEILKSKYQALGYDKRYGAQASQIGCIDLGKIPQLAKKEHYAFKSSLSQAKKVCFDSFGRPYVEGDAIDERTEVLQLSYNGKKATLSLLPMSGYVIIEH